MIPGLQSLSNDMEAVEPEQVVRTVVPSCSGSLRGGGEPGREGRTIGATQKHASRTLSSLNTVHGSHRVPTSPFAACRPTAD